MMQKKSWMCGKLNNKGMSLVEIIIIIAIIGILAVASLSLAGNIRYANTQKAVENIGDKMDSLQVTTMSKSQKQYLYIYRVGGDYYAKTTTDCLSSFDNKVLDDKGTKLSNSALNISYVPHNGEDEVTVGPSNFIRICYKRSGGFSYSASGTTCDKIYVKGSRTYTITLAEETGKHFIE